MPNLYARLQHLTCLGGFFAARHLEYMLKKETCGNRYCLHMTVNFTHETFNSKHVIFIFKTESLCHFLLVFKEKLVIFSAAQVMQPVADTNQVILGLLKLFQFLLAEEPCFVQRI